MRQQRLYPQDQVAGSPSSQRCCRRRRVVKASPALSAAAEASTTLAHQVSERVKQTDEPVIVKTKRLMAAAAGTKVVSLAQGVVHWAPPQQSLDAASQALERAQVHSYGPASGMPELVTALETKVATDNRLQQHKIMVTAGANQAFVNIVLSLLDPGSRVVLFKPYYFNHLMAIQMTGSSNSVVFGPCNPQTFHPDLVWLEQQLQGPDAPKMVVITNPCNPTGTLLSKQELEYASDLCRRVGAYLVLDNTYEHFTYDCRQHHCVSAPHVLHIFSFSKAYGMMGWRVGYIAYSDDDTGQLSLALTKVQDTIPICPPQLSQYVALAAITRAGKPWVQQQLGSIIANRDWLIDALTPLGSLGNGIAGGEGAIYLFAKLPPGADDEVWVQQLITDHGVCVIPGSACGSPGYIRVAFANLKPADCADAAVRLNKGLKTLIGRRADRLRKQLITV